MIIIESIKDYLVPFIANLNTSKDMYDKLVNLYSISTTGQKMSLRNKFYIMKKPKDEDRGILPHESISTKRPPTRTWGNNH